MKKFCKMQNKNQTFSSFSSQQFRVFEFLQKTQHFKKKNQNTAKKTTENVVCECVGVDIEKCVGRCVKFDEMLKMKLFEI